MKGSRPGLAFCFFLLFSGLLFAQTGPDALMEYRNNNFERAVEICKNEIAANPYNLESYVVISWSLIRLGRYNEAMDNARAGRNISRYDVRITEALGEICYYLGRNTLGATTRRSSIFRSI